MSLSVFISDYTKHGSVPPPRQLFESTQSCSHIYVFPTSVKLCIRKDWKQQQLDRALHFHRTHAQCNIHKGKKKKKTAYMDQTKCIFSKASLKDGTPLKGLTRKTQTF